MKSSILKNDFIISFTIGIVIFLVFLVATANLILSGFMWLFFTVFLYLSSTVSARLGIKRHHNIIKSNGFQRLIKNGFRIERVNKYVGITGVYNDYIVDVYYDWNTFVRNGVGKAFVIVAYFKPLQPLHEYHCANYDFVIKMKKKYNRYSPFDFKEYNFYWNEGSLEVSDKIRFRNPSFEKIQSRIKLATEILANENLHPINREELNYIRKKFRHQSVPAIELYHEKKSYSN